MHVSAHEIRDYTQATTSFTSAKWASPACTKTGSKCSNQFVNPFYTVERNEQMATKQVLHAVQTGRQVTKMVPLL